MKRNIIFLSPLNHKQTILMRYSRDCVQSTIESDYAIYKNKATKVIYVLSLISLLLIIKYSYTTYWGI